MQVLACYNLHALSDMFDTNCTQSVICIKVLLWVTRVRRQVLFSFWIHFFKRNTYINATGSKYSLNGEHVIKLISSHRLHDVLWNVKLAQYKNQDTINQAYKIIADEIKLRNFGPSDVPNKIKNLRFQLTIGKIEKYMLQRNRVPPYRYQKNLRA